MGRPQLLTALLALVLVGIIYHLPRVVVENETTAEVASHDFTISQADATAMISLKQGLDDPVTEKSNNFADSLARYYLKYGLLDSAQLMADRILAGESSLSNTKRVIGILYPVFERSLNNQEAIKVATKLRPMLEEVLAAEPQNADLKVKLAMTLVTSENPMTGINLLREVVAVDSLNREALINLGLLSIRSGQFEKALSRFEVLLDLDSTDAEAKLYKAITHIEVGQEELANELFEEIASSESVDPAIRQSALEYLERN